MATIQVTPELLMSKANEVRSLISTHVDAMTKLNTLVNGLSEDWRGLMQDAFVADFGRMRSMFISFSDELKGYADFMDTAAMELKRTDERLSQLPAGLTSGAAMVLHIPTRERLSQMNVGEAETGKPTRGLDRDKVIDTLDTVDEIRGALEDIFGDMLPDWFKNMPVYALIMKHLITGVSNTIRNLVAADVTTGAAVGRAVADAVYAGFDVAAMAVFGKVGADIGGMVGLAVSGGSHLGFWAGRAIGGLSASMGSSFLVDYFFLNQASTAFGLVKVDGLGIRDTIADAVANIVGSRNTGAAYSASSA